MGGEPGKMMNKTKMRECRYLTEWEEGTDGCRHFWVVKGCGWGVGVALGGNQLAIGLAGQKCWEIKELSERERTRWSSQFWWPEGGRRKWTAFHSQRVGVMCVLPDQHWNLVLLWSWPLGDTRAGIQDQVLGPLSWWKLNPWQICHGEN